MKNSKKGIALLSAMALTYLIVRLSSFVKVDFRSSETQETNKNTRVINQVEVSVDEVMSFHQPFIDNENIYTMLINQSIPFCKIDDEYYTLNGNKILFYMAKEYASPIEMVVTDENGNKTTYLEPPEGYTLVGNQAIKYVERATILPDDMLINLQQANEISVISIVDSKPYSSLLEEDLSLNLIKR